MPYHGTILILLTIVPCLVSDFSQPRLLGSIPLYPSSVVLLPRFKVWKPQKDGNDERQMAEASPRQSKSVPHGASLKLENTHKIKTFAYDDRSLYSAHLFPWLLIEWARLIPDIPESENKAIALVNFWVVQFHDMKQYTIYPHVDYLVTL